ncbi:MAG: glycine cleavage system protein H, partial [Bacteroidota bacterium]
LTADHFVQRARAQKVLETVRDRVSSIVEALKQIPAGVELAMNHMWLKDESNSIVTVGLDEFVAKFFGAVEKIILPKTGEAAGKVCLIDGERSLEIACPVNGRVIAVNPEVLRNPSSSYTDPYGKGWLFQVEVATPRHHPSASGLTTSWLQDQIAAAREFFLGRAGAQNYALMQDGGAIVDGVLKMYDNSVWAEFGDRFLASPSSVATTVVESR